MKVSELNEMYDTRKDHRREAGDQNWHNSVNLKADAHAKMVKGFWLMDGSKKISGPYGTRDKAESFKKNRPDRIPASATIKEF